MLEELGVARQSSSGCARRDRLTVPPLTWLYVPADRPDRVEKAIASAAHAVIVDLEDGVAPGAKAEARAGPRRAALDAARDKPVYVRVNAGDADDLEAVAALRAERRRRAQGRPARRTCPAIALPGALPDRVGRRSRGRVRDRAALRESPGSRSASPTSARRPARSKRGSTGRAAGSSTPPSPPACRGRRSRSTRTLRDDEGLARSCARGRELGHLGRAAIHPGAAADHRAGLPADRRRGRAGSRDRRAARGRRRGHARGRRVRRRRDARRGAADRGLGRLVRHLNTSTIREGLMKNRLTPALAGCAALLLVMLAPSAVGSSSAAAAGSITGGSFQLGDARRGDHLQRLSAGRLRGLDRSATPSSISCTGAATRRAPGRR